jgi:hypothetical protein
MALHEPLLRFKIVWEPPRTPASISLLTVLGGIFGYLQAVSEGLGEVINITRISWALVEAERHGLPIASPSTPHRVATKRI